ncbi:MAG: hypothetical protein IPM69_06675 [Ignavibacteria bacterium]|nr:hypothetical protein [Ignavibacteria bacterium]
MNLRSTLALLLPASIFVSLISSCGSNMITDPADIIFPDSNVSYQNHVQPLLTLSCAYSGCHNDETAAANLRLTNYFALFQHAGLIVPLKPDNSTLIQTLEGTLPHRATYYQTATDAQKKGMRLWVKEGAKNN